MERLNLHMAQELATRYRLVVIGPRGARAALPGGIVVHECGRGTVASFLVAAWVRTVLAALWNSPAWIVAGSGLTAPIAWMAARVSGARVAVYVHGLDLVVRHAVYRAAWLPFIRRADACIANSGNTARLAGEAGVPAVRIDIVHPGVALPERHPSQNMLDGFRRRHSLEGRRILLSVGRMTERKGLREFVLKALPQIARAHPEVILVVIGDEAPDALTGSARGAWLRLRDEATAAGLGHALVHLGALEDEELALAYASSDVHVFPVRDVPGDVEGFGMVAIEAAAYGLPTVAFHVGGVPDAVSHGETGYLVPPRDYQAFATRVVQVLDGGTPGRAATTAFASRFAWPAFAARLFAIFDRAGAA
jgi:phosphatidylinositol alpha-1,6-mannosyltransferase